MATITFKTHPRVPDTLWHYLLILLSETVTACMRKPEEAERIAEMAAQEAARFVATEPLEHVAANKGLSWAKFARLRIKFERNNFKLMRDSIFPHSSRPGILTIVRAVDLVVRDMDRAYELAPPLDDEKTREVPAIELPDPEPTPTPVNYSSMISE
jgi:hypothetical protein